MSSSAHSTQTTHSVHEVDEYGRTDLHYRADVGDINKVKTLILSGYRVDARDNDGWTPLHYAASEGHRDVVKELLRAGSEINAESKSKLTPLHLSAFSGHTETVQVLVREGARLDAQDYFGKTPLHNAAKRGYREVVEELLQAGAEINAENKNKSTPLHLSANNGHIDTVKVLIREGAQLDVQNAFGRTPLHLSICQCDCVWLNTSKLCKYYSDIITVLINSGVSLNIKDNHGLTALHVSALHGWYEIVKMLINSGCEIDPVNDGGYTPLQLAKQKGNLVIVNLLREAKPFQHGDKTLYRMKKTVKMFFGFSRTVEREEGGAVGGRNIQSGDVNAEILENTYIDKEFEDVEPLSTVSVPSEVVTWPPTSGTESLPTCTDTTSTTDQRKTDTFQSVAACLQYTEESTVSTERLTATTVSALPPVISTTSSPSDVTASPLTAACTSKTGIVTTLLSNGPKQTSPVSPLKTSQRSRIKGKRQGVANLSTLTRSRSVDSLLPCSVLPVTKFHTPSSDISASAHESTAITSSSLSASATSSRLTVTSPTPSLLPGAARRPSRLDATDTTSSPFATVATLAPTEWMSTLPPQGSGADPVDLLPSDFKQFVRDCKTRASDTTGYSSHEVDKPGTYNFHYTVHNHYYYSCDHEDGTCRKLTASTSRVEEQVCNASTINTTPVTCSRTSEKSSFLMASREEGAATASFTHRDDTTLPNTTVVTSSETFVTSLGTTRRSSFITSSPQRDTASISPQTTDTDLLASIMTATPPSSSTVTSSLASTSLSSPTTVTTSPFVTRPLSLSSTHTATASSPAPSTATTTSPSLAPVVSTSTSAAGPDLAETLTKFTEQLKTALQSTPGEDQRSSTFAVETSGSGNTPLFQVYNVNLNPTTTNVHEAGTVAIGSNIRNVERRETKKRNDENDSESDRKSLDSDDNENSASGL